MYQEIIESGVEYLPRLIDGLQASAAFFRQGSETKGIEQFTKAFDGLEWIAAVINGLPQLSKGQVLPTDVFESIRRTLAELEEAWSVQDFVTIGDLTEYELVTHLQGLLEWFDGQAKLLGLGPTQ
ncbi:hypothetical protein GTO89_08335 [Heliobacterium gestii]|uniref:Uncharacterized protein n=1 Tax=Heliomicrobium gestii TaxID=2699 RepID=A0A845L8T3_HELGE|nr:hypothetical protein [Heliomicrobium gestii]MBM7866678.1 hypothetical protein [Heliomicrobium gestii]MZP43042.1 hypothetical protein [Heliomicrobium gestii]